MYASMFYFALSLELSRELQEREFIILKKGLSLIVRVNVVLNRTVVVDSD